MGMKFQPWSGAFFSGSLQTVANLGLGNPECGPFGCSVTQINHLSAETHGHSGHCGPPGLRSNCAPYSNM